MGLKLELNYVKVMFVCEFADPFSEEDMEGNEELRPEYSCPFCTEDFDMVGLCCHMDESHAAETKNEVCFVLFFLRILFCFFELNLSA